MRATFAIAALAGTALAAPSYGKPQGNHKNVHVVVETVVHTVYVTEGYEVTKPTPSPEPVYEAPEVTSTVVYEEPKPSSKYEAPAEPTPVPEAPKPTPTPEPVPETPPSTSEGYMGIVDEYRSKMGLSALSQDAKLESNAKDCAASGNGQMVHKLNPGSFAQVLAPGDCSNFMETFKKAFVGGWLCELPNTPGLGNECATMSEGWAYEGQTGHAEILTSTSYSKIGCGCEGGIVACDLS